MASHHLSSEGYAQTCRGYQTFSAPAPAPVVIGETNAMVQRVDTAYAKAQKTPQLSFGQDGVTVQQPVVSILFRALHSLWSYPQTSCAWLLLPPKLPDVADSLRGSFSP